MEGFALTLPVDVALLGAMRHALSSWLESVGVADCPRADVVLATHEAVANAMEHSGSMEPVNVAATFLSGEVTVEVTDKGSWKHRLVPCQDRGRGLNMIRELVSKLEILKRTSGTTLRITQYA
jgi:anti-sigma regulatory factor (Ser/Thr protein kinase)